MLALKRARKIAEDKYIKEQIENELRSYFDHFNIQQIEIESLEPCDIKIYVEPEYAQSSFKTQVRLNILNISTDVYIHPCTNVSM
jgi:hypothetical protein